MKGNTKRMGNWIVLGDWGIVNLDTVKSIKAGNNGISQWGIVMDYLDDHQQTYVFGTEKEMDWMYQEIRRKCGLPNNIIPPPPPPPPEKPFPQRYNEYDYSWINSIKKYFM